MNWLQVPEKNSKKSLFIYLPGMDGTGKLLPGQITLRQSVDLRCLSIPPEDLSNWQGLAERAIALIGKELRANPRRQVYLCGESFGGCLALKLIEAAPQWFTHLVLVNPASSFSRGSWLSWGANITHFMPDCLYFAATFALLPFLGALEKIRPRDRQALLKAMQSLSARTVSWRVSLMQNFQSDEGKLRLFSQPVSILASGSDRILPSVAEARRLSGIFPNAKTKILPASGHTCLLEKNLNLWAILKSLELERNKIIATVSP